MMRTITAALFTLAIGSCVDQGQPADQLGTTEQNSTAPIYSNIPIEWWTRKDVAPSDYWDFGTTAPNYNMTAFIVAGEPADANGPATRMVWIIGPTRVYKVYEVYVTQVEEMATLMRDNFTYVQNTYHAAGHVTAGSAIITGVDGGLTGGGKKGGGPVHGFPQIVVDNMQNQANALINITIAAPQIPAGSLAVGAGVGGIVGAP